MIYNINDMVQFSLRPTIRYIIVLAVITVHSLQAQISEGGYPLSFSVDIGNNIPIVITGPG